ncbi:alpha-galactosidase [Streptococcus merionis]|uniref:alpha-galactosidase n=1 Tax=Streptococcus merionis TaxID=400065 RepID=UPI0026EB1682|nr:alpha-galactosidase [Streptococcus merionis]
MIIVHEQDLLFHLNNDQVSYVFRVMEDTGILENLYYGSTISDYENFDWLLEREIRPGNNLVSGKLLTSLEHIKQEMPVYGTTDFRYPALEVTYPDGDSISHFRYQGYKVFKGKEVVKPLPATFGEADQVQVLEVFLKDDYSGLHLTLRYAIYRGLPVITRQAILQNKGQQDYLLKHLASLNVDLPNEQYDWLHLDGAWARENHLSREKIHRGVQQVSSTRGASSHVHNPFLAICQPQTTESQGKVYGFSLIYSGNFQAQIELDNYDYLRIQLGINPFQFQWQLRSGETFVSPEAVAVFSSHGLNGMSQAFHNLFRRHLIRSSWKDVPRPVLLNSWEAAYFDFDEKKILDIAGASKELGVELFVLDDGWFGSRNSDKGSLGNWTENCEKLPRGLASLARDIKAMGLQFGLWFEPEMVSDDTLLYQAHPDWIIGHPKKNISQGRNQYVLDFGNPKVVDAIYDQVDKILQEVPIDYLKLDMNRYISEAYSSELSPVQQGEVAHRYILGVYALYDRLANAYPHILIESCAGGGARFDAGMLYYSPQIWTSDNTDAVERLVIQAGTSMVYPLSSMGSHVSAVPNHQIARITSLDMRKNVAFFGVFGYELNPLALTQEEKGQIRQQIKEYKVYQELIMQGDFYRLETNDTNRIAWMVVSPDQSEALVGYYQILAQPNQTYQRLRLRGLKEDTCYQVIEGNTESQRYGCDLESIGLLLNQNYLGRESEYWSRETPGDFSSRLVYLKRV